MTDSRFARQSFLGHDSDHLIAGVRIGVVGASGGGSHVVQQLAHLGFMDYAVFDAQVIEESNLNRLVGATEDDVARGTLKVAIAERVIRGVRSAARIDAVPHRWQDRPEILRTRDIIVGCVDGFAERLELETVCRRYLIPYIDIGMDVFVVDGQPPRVVGQVILSLPGLPCMQCLGFINERTLAREAARYGQAGAQPQVVWPNGILASTAVGIAVDLVTNWSRSTAKPIYLSYDGNSGTLTPHVRLGFLQRHDCPHHRYQNLGDPNL